MLTGVNVLVVRAVLEEAEESHAGLSRVAGDAGGVPGDDLLRSDGPQVTGLGRSNGRGNDVGGSSADSGGGSDERGEDGSELVGEHGGEMKLEQMGSSEQGSCEVRTEDSGSQSEGTYTFSARYVAGVHV